MHSMTNLFRFIAARHMRLRPGRTAFAVLGIACGIALYIAISIINESTSGFFRDSMTAVSGKARLTISAGELGFDENIGEQVEKIEGITDAVPVLETRSWLLTTNESLMVLGVDLLQEKGVRNYKTEGKQIIGDSLSFIAQPDSLILTDSFAKSHGFKPGDKLELSTARGRAKFTIRGILEPTGLATAYGGALAIMDIDSARVAFGKLNKTDHIDVVTAKGVDVDQTAEKLRALLGTNYIVERPEMNSQQMEQMIKSFQFMSQFISMLALIVGVFLISNSVSMSVAERSKEIGTLRALGTKRISILILFISEAFAMGTMGAFIGAFLGRGLAGIMVESVTKAMTTTFHQTIEASSLKFTSSTVLSAVAIGAAASIIAALLPSIKATRVQAIDAMKRKNTGEEAVKTGFRRYLGLIGSVLFGGSLLTSYLVKNPDLAWLQVVMQIGAIVGSALIGPALVLGFVRLIRPMVLASSNLVPRLAVDNILRNPKRTASNVTSLMVGLILVVIIASINVSFKGTLLKFFARIMHADLIISSNGKLQSHESQPLGEELKAKIEANPGVLGAYELREIKFNYEGQKILLKHYGEPPKPEFATSVDGEIEQRYNIFDTADRDVEEAGKELYHSPDPTVMVSENFVTHFNKKTGDSIELTTPNGPKKFRIIGIVAEYASPIGTIVMARSVFGAYFSDHLVSGYAVKLKRGFDPIQVRSELDRELGKEFKLTIMLNGDIRKQVISTMDSSFAYTRAIEMAALIVALLGLMNTLIITVMERTREIGLSRAVGLTRKHITRMIIIEAVSQGGLGALISMGLGTALGMLWVTQNLARSLGWVVHFYVPWAALGTTFALGIVVTLIAAWYPARRAAHIEIVDALDYE